MEPEESFPEFNIDDEIDLEAQIYDEIQVDEIDYLESEHNSIDINNHTESGKLTNIENNYSPPKTNPTAPHQHRYDQSINEVHAVSKNIGCFQNFVNGYSNIDIVVNYDNSTTQLLHDRPSLYSSSIVLENGSQKFISKRVSDTSAILSSTFRSEIPNLLSRSMKELTTESELKKINRIINKNQDKSISVDAHNSNTYEKLWVDKYSPTNFSQLLSPEKINRDVLFALKLWDKFIFHKDVPVHHPSEFNSTFTDGSKKYNENFKKRHYDDGEEGDEADGEAQKSDSRPFRKVILLAGPPGTGKTTLAHIIARQCGYRTIEVNASDDRSVKAITDIMQRTMTSNTISADKKPSCLVLDEVDGIEDKATIDAITKIVKNPLKGKNKSGDKFCLTRPVICICNDPYSPALRDLKALCEVFVFSPPTETRLIQRLKNVCLSEGLMISGTTLAMLCQTCGQDIRSAINTLQFANIKCKNMISSSNQGVQKSSVVDYGAAVSSLIVSGMKDRKQDIFQVCRQILSKKEAATSFDKKNSLKDSYSKFAGSQRAASGRQGTGTYAMDVVGAAVAFGDNSLVFDGVFENYLKVNYLDTTFQRTAMSAEWISFSDALLGNDFSSHYEMLPYTSCALGAVHLLASSEASTSRLSFPNKDRLYRQKRQRKENILTIFVDGAMKASLNSSRIVAALDVVAPLLDIIALVGSRRATTSLSTITFSEQDHKRISEIVMIMMNYKLNYETSTAPRDAAGGVSSGGYDLDPNLAELMSYESSDELFGRRSTMPPEIRNILRLEIRKRLIDGQAKANEGVLYSSSATTHHAATRATPSAESKKRNSATFELLDKQSSSPAIANVAVVQDDLSKKKAKFDFFGQQKKGVVKGANPSPNASISVEARNNILRDQIKFKFNQGFSNAVRRPVSISEFL